MTYIDDDTEFLRSSEVAEIFHVSAKTVARWANLGKLPFMWTLGGPEGRGHRRYPKREIMRLLRMEPVTNGPERADQPA